MSYYFLLGYRSFKTEREIKQVVVEYYNTIILTSQSQLNVSNSNLLDQEITSKIGQSEKKIKISDVHCLKIFENKNQQTWIASAKEHVFCLLDDIEVDIEKDFELIRWVTPINVGELKFHTSQKSPDRVGLVDFGDKHKRWYYSKKLLNDEEMAKTYIENIILSGKSS